VLQSLAGHDPDVDAIYRLTQPLPLNFDAQGGEKLVVLLPKRTLAPYNAQATLHFHSSLFALLLPTTVHGR
jgi:hypothetical protein